MAKTSIPLSKLTATGLGVALAGVETWLNSEHIARVEGWASSLVVAVVVASVSAAASLPLAERAVKAGQIAKAIGLAVFFCTMVAFSFCASVERVGSKRDGEKVLAHSDNVRVKLAQDAYDAARKTAEGECAKSRGTKCREAEKAVTEARKALSEKPAERIEDSMARRISAALPFLTEEQVALYQPLALPVGLQLGGFLMLALGLAPKSPEAGQPRRKKGNRKSKRTRKSQAQTAKVVPFRANDNRRS